MAKPLVTIENWSAVRVGTYLAYQELEEGCLLTGRVFGHSKLPDQKLVFTSPILSVDEAAGTVETRNTMYSLGQPSAEYKSWSSEQKSVAAA